MVARRTSDKPATPRRPPATTPIGREQQLVALAVDLAERQLIEGNASAQVINHYLKLGSSREHLEQERLKKENELLQAKKDAMESAQRVEALMTEAIEAFKSYSPSASDDIHDR